MSIDYKDRSNAQQEIWRESYDAGIHVARRPYSQEGSSMIYILHLQAEREDLYVWSHMTWTRPKTFYTSIPIFN